MANLVPLSKSPLVKQKKSAIVKADKFLPAKSESTSLAKITKNKSSENILVSIEKKVIKIDKLLKNSLLLSQKEIGNKRKKQEQQEFTEREKELEKKKAPPIKGIKLPSLPKMGFLDWIKNFITQTILGFLFIKFYDFLPQLLRLLPVILKVGDFIIDVGGKLLDGLITFVDWGYKAIDGTRSFIKQLGGEGLAKNFDKFAGAIDNVIEVAIIAALATADSGGFGGRHPGDLLGDQLKRRGAQQAAQQGARQVASQAAGTATRAGGIGAGAVAGIVAGAGLLSSALGEGAFQLRKIATKPIQDAKKAFDNEKNPLMKIGRGASLAGMGLLLGPLSALGVLLDVVGAPFRYAIELLRFPFLSEKDKQKQAYNLAKMDARIREDFRKALNIVTLGFAFKEKGSFGNIYGNKGAQKEMMSKMAGGGQPVTRGGQTSGGPSRRTIKKKKKSRSISFAPRKIKPGKNAGGEEKVRQVFPNPEKAWWDPFGLFTKKPEQPKPEEKPKGKTVNSQEFLIRSNDELGRSDYFGPFFTLAIKSVLGEKPDVLDYKNAGKGLNSWIQSTFNAGQLAFAGGGEVDAKQFFEGEDYTDVIAKSVEDSVSKRVDATIRDLKNELSLRRPVGKEEMRDMNMKERDKDQDPSLDVGPGGTVTGGNADFWTLVAISRMEDSDPQGSADVAQSIYNRVASGIYGGKTIKEIVLRQGQYEPTWKYPTRGRTGVPNPEWHGIKDLATASKATGISQGDLQKTAAALRNSKYQEEARKFIGGRTDFMGGSNQPGPGDIRRKGNEPNNFFGWFVGPAAKSYGAKNPGPARAPQLGDIVVMGGGGEAESLGKGYGSAGSKIAGELGRFMKKKGVVPGSVHRHPEHPPYSLTSGHSRGSLHYQGRAIDLGAYANEQGPILKAVAEFNKMKGVKPVQLLHAGNEPSGHSDHVHVAYEKGGKTLDKPHMAMLGEKGREFVIDADSTDAIEGTFPGFLDAINKAKYDDAIQVLRNFVSYEQPYAEPEVHFIEVPVEVPVPIPTGGGGGYFGGGGSIDNKIPGQETLVML